MNTPLFRHFSTSILALALSLGGGFAMTTPAFSTPSQATDDSGTDTKKPETPIPAPIR